MIKRAHTSTPPEVNVRLTTSDSQSVTMYSERHLTLPIPGSILKARNAQGTHP